MSNTAGYKVHDGQSMTVTVPDTMTVQQGEFALIEGFFGLCEGQPKIVAAGAADIELTIAQQVYSSDQVVVAEAMARGAVLYFDSTARLLTVTAATNRVVGRVATAKDANNIVEFVLFGQRGT
jgi:predicted RecA/RadA family phage recombinase